MEKRSIFSLKTTDPIEATRSALANVKSVKRTKPTNFNWLDADKDIVYETSVAYNTEPITISLVGKKELTCNEIYDLGYKTLTSEQIAERKEREKQNGGAYYVNPLMASPVYPGKKGKSSKVPVSWPYGGVPALPVGGPFPVVPPTVVTPLAPRHSKSAMGIMEMPTLQPVYGKRFLTPGVLPIGGPLGYLNALGMINLWKGKEVKFVLAPIDGWATPETLKNTVGKNDLETAIKEALKDQVDQNVTFMINDLDYSDVTKTPKSGGPAKQYNAVSFKVRMGYALLSMIPYASFNSSSRRKLENIISSSSDRVQFAKKVIENLKGKYNNATTRIFDETNLDLNDTDIAL